MGRTTEQLGEMADEDAPRLTPEDIEWYFPSPQDGGIPGLVRRVRRILDVSQRGLAAILEVSQSVVARWETGRTSPRSSVLLRLLRMARLMPVLVDEDTGEEVTPMRDDGCRDRATRRHPAHVDLTVGGWWAPPGSMSTNEWFAAQQRSRKRGEPLIRHRTDRHHRQLQRLMYGTPDDHPAHDQLVAEAVHLDEKREERARMRRSAGVRPPRSSLTA